ncbi:MAG: hypothetical protein WC549_07580 [Actinomycetota bacterium]
MSDELNDIDKPWRVVTIPDNNFHSGHMEKAHADVQADQANKDAEKLEIKTRYKVIEKPI